MNWQLVLVGLVLSALSAKTVNCVPTKHSFVAPRAYLDENDDDVNFVNGRITNGQLAFANQFPYQVGMNFQSGASRWVCGGTIISKDFILTAGHCTDQAKNVTIHLATLDRLKPNIVMHVSGRNIMQHEKYYDAYLYNDISLIKLPEPLSFSDSIQPVKMLKRADSYQRFEGEMAIASGWGKISDSEMYAYQYLQWVEVQVVSNRYCGSYYSSILISDKTLCVDTVNKKSTCNGDSGGPLVLASTGELIGVTSFVASTGCESEVPSGFSRVTSYYDWIEEKTGLTF